MITKKNRINFTYIKFYKPYGVLTSFTDTESRPTLADYIADPGVYPAGRLDIDSEGLMLLTNDGTLNHRITSPRYHLPKVYLVQIEGIPDSDSMDKLRKGPIIKGDYKTKHCLADIIESPNIDERIKPVTIKKETSWLKITLREGKKRQVRHMTAAVGYPTLRLIRVSIGRIELSNMTPGEWRYLKNEDIRNLQNDLR